MRFHSKTQEILGKDLEKMMVFLPLRVYMSHSCTEKKKKILILFVGLIFFFFFLRVVRYRMNGSFFDLKNVKMSVYGPSVLKTHGSS